MSQRRANKRKRETESTNLNDQRQAEKEIVSKRARLNNKPSLPENRSKAKGTTPGNSEKIDDKDCAEKSTVRRSGRTPKAKARDYDDITHVSNSPVLSKDLAPSSTSIPTLSAPSLDSIHGASLTLDAYACSPKSTPESGNFKETETRTPAFEVGHKRETRKSYQKYLEELGFGNDLTSDTKKRSRQSSSEREHKNSNKGSKEGSAKKNDRTKSLTTTTSIQPNPIAPTKFHVTPKTPTQSTPNTPIHSSRTTTKEQRVEIITPAMPSATSVSKQSDMAILTGQTEEDFGDLSPKVRTSKRTPIPKRKFSLLEDLPEDSKNAKTSEPGRDKMQSIESKSDADAEMNLSSETQLQNDKNKRRLSVEKCSTTSSVPDTSLLVSVKDQTPKQRVREKKQDSVPQSKRSSSKAKNVKSSDCQVHVESKTLYVSGDTLVAVTRTPETPKSHILGPGVKQVESQSKKSDRKKRKQVPVSSVNTSSVISDMASPLGNKSSLEAIGHKRKTTGSTHAQAVPISEIVSAASSKHKTPEKNNIKSKQKPSQKSSEKKKKKGEEAPGSLTDSLSSPLDDSDTVEFISPTISPGSSSHSKHELNVSPPGSEVLGDSDSTKKKKKTKKTHSDEKTPKSPKTPSESEPSPHHHHHHHHHHKHHKHSKTKKITETATAVVREEPGEHIILKLHLRKDESSKKLDARKPKPKISTHSSSGESKKHVHSKSKKLTSFEPASSKSTDNSLASGPVTECKKKLSIKFKGLSQDQIGLEIPTNNIQPSETESIYIPERTKLSAAKHKKKKDEKKTKKNMDSGVKRTDKKDEEEKKPVKLVIKKDKTLLAGQEKSPTGIKVQAQKTKKIVKKSVGENSAVKKEGTGEQKKKGKEGSSSKTSPSPVSKVSCNSLSNSFLF